VACKVHTLSNGNSTLAGRAVDVIFNVADL
jgi:hypothetical protein